MRSAMRSLAVLAISLTPLAGCATGVSDRACPPLRVYSREEQAQAADELDRLGPGSTTGRFMADYGTLRDAVRAMCR